MIWTTKTRTRVRTALRTVTITARIRVRTALKTARIAKININGRLTAAEKFSPPFFVSYPRAVEYFIIEKVDNGGVYVFDYFNEAAGGISGTETGS